MYIFYAVKEVVNSFNSIYAIRIGTGQQLLSSVCRRPADRALGYEMFS